MAVTPLIPPTKTWPTASERLLSMGPVGPRLSTGIASLDRLLRGGVPGGKRVVLVGGPGACKTMMGTLWTYRWEESGAAVVYLAADESPEGIATRLGQLAGYTREDLEADDDRARRAAAMRLTDRRILLLDGEDASLEDAIEALGPAAPDDRQRVLVVDSLQTVRCLAATGIDSIRERITTVMAMLRGPARSGAIVVAISEMARGGYRNGGADRTQETSALAAAKESGSVEYGADLLLGMRSVRDEVGQIDIETAKNRLGRTPPPDERIRLRLDYSTATLAEISTPDPEHVARGAASAKLARAKDRVRKALMAHELRSANAVAMAAGGTRSDALAALKEMRASGEVVEVSGVMRLSSGVSHED